MRTLLRLTLILGTIVFLFIGLFLMIDSVELITQHQWFEGTKLEDNQAFFLVIWFIGYMSIVLAGFVLTSKNNLWEKIKTLEEKEIKLQSDIDIYTQAKTDLALETIGYVQRRKALNDKIIEYNNKLKELNNGPVDKTD